MYRNYIFPLQIFLILEKIPVNFFYSSKNYFNSYNVFVNKNIILKLTYILKNELFLNESMMIENSAIDLSFSKNLNNFFDKNSSRIVFYNFWINSIKVKLFIYFFLNTKKNNNINSIDRIFLNANWIERETSEMYDVFFYNKKDHRKLMLDYSSFESPLLKKYPLEGRSQVFFSFFENQVIVQNNKYIEI